MSTTKVTRNYQITIPSDIRKKVEVKAGDVLIIEYIEDDDSIRIRLPHKGPRTTMKLGHPLTPEDIESSIEKGMTECLRS